MKAKLTHISEQVGVSPESWRRAALTLCFVAIIASLALPYIRLTVLGRTDTFTGIDLVASRQPSPDTIPPDEFVRTHGESYEAMMGEGALAREALRAEDEELAREIFGERVVAVLVLALALVGLAATLIGQRFLTLVAAMSGTVVLAVGTVEGAHPFAILEVPPSADHLVGWWLAFGLFASVALAELVRRWKARADSQTLRGGGTRPV
jgi:hypothetical protein